MKKKIMSAFAAGMMGMMFGILYPEYILLPDTYHYVKESDWSGQENTKRSERNAKDHMNEMLYGDSKQIKVSSRFFQFLLDEGIVLWKNME